MPWGLTRFQHSAQSHFVTFCCYHRRRLFATDERRRIFESALERIRRSFELQVYGYVVMPEHVHLLVSEPGPDAFSDRNAPLQPKDGLNGPPPTFRILYAISFAGRKLIVEDNAEKRTVDFQSTATSNFTMERLPSKGRHDVDFAPWMPDARCATIP